MISIIFCKKRNVDVHKYACHGTSVNNYNATGTLLNGTGESKE